MLILIVNFFLGNYYLVQDLTLSVYFHKSSTYLDLQYQLHKVEKEKSSALLIQSDLVKKYRAAATALSGFQIKLKEDDLVQVESIFDPGNYFVFKVHLF